ncbi:MAG: hypothetical protein JWO82_4155, partial [Akkermansiaceae bacterium]|nr:hypothetical protein [Akkermansiaceae bacterium]
MNSELTVILTLRGRHLHTLRWMWHANRTKFPFHIIIADGEVHASVDRVLSDAANFPNLSYEYHRHRDLSFTDFYRKCSETVRRVKTKYVMMSDNDDFPIVAGIRKSIAFLDAKPEYVSAGGEIPNFTVIPRTPSDENVVGAMVNLSFGYVQGVHDIAFPSTAERVMDVVSNYHVTYYHVVRTEALRLIFEEAENHNFSDLSVHEFFCAARTVMLGKVKSDPAVISYIRQTGTSMLSTYYKDWVHHLLRTNLPRDYRQLAATLAGEVHRLEGADANEFQDRILDLYAARLRHQLGHMMMRHRFPKLYRIKRRLGWLRKFISLPQGFQDLLCTRRFWSELSRDCPDQALLSQYRVEFSEAKGSLQGDAF